MSDTLERNLCSNYYHGTCNEVDLLCPCKGNRASDSCLADSEVQAGSLISETPPISIQLVEVRDLFQKSRKLVDLGNKIHAVYQFIEDPLLKKKVDDLFLQARDLDVRKSTSAYNKLSNWLRKPKEYGL